MPFTLTGIESVRRKLVGVKPSVRRKVVQALNVEAESIVTDSKQNYVPVREGALRNTGHVEHAKHTTTGDITATMRFGPIVTAVVIHEVPDFNPPSWGGGEPNFGRGGPKYLELPMRVAIPGMAERIANVVKF